MNYRHATFAVVFALALLFWRILHVSGEIGVDLVFGWIGFLARVLPEARFRWDGAAIFAGGLCLAVAVAHGFLRWLYAEWKSVANRTHPGWRFRWTLELLGSVMLMFAAGISFVGMSHQIVWLGQSPQRLFGRHPVTRGVSRFKLKDLGLAFHNAADGGAFNPRRRPQEIESPRSWVVDVLPYLAGGYITPEIDKSRAWDDPVNASHFKSLVPELLNPGFRNPPIRDRERFGLNHYAGNSVLFDKVRDSDVGQGAFQQSHLLLIGEVNSQFVPWGYPDNSRDPSQGINTPDGFGGPPVQGGALFVMADGSVRAISNDVDPKVLKTLSQPRQRDADAD